MTQIRVTNSDEKEILKIADVKDKYPRQWVTVEITEYDKYGLPLKGIVLIASKDKKEVVNYTKNVQSDNLYLFYSGRIDDQVA